MSSKLEKLRKKQKTRPRQRQYNPVADDYEGFVRNSNDDDNKEDLAKTEIDTELSEQSDAVIKSEENKVSTIESNDEGEKNKVSNEEDKVEENNTLNIEDEVKDEAVQETKIDVSTNETQEENSDETVKIESGKNNNLDENNKSGELGENDNLNEINNSDNSVETDKNDDSDESDKYDNSDEQKESIIEKSEKETNTDDSKKEIISNKSIELDVNKKEDVISEEVEEIKFKEPEEEKEEIFSKEPEEEENITKEVKKDTNEIDSEEINNSVNKNEVSYNESIDLHSESVHLEQISDETSNMFSDVNDIETDNSNQVNTEDKSELTDLMEKTEQPEKTQVKPKRNIPTFADISKPKEHDLEQTLAKLDEFEKKNRIFTEILDGNISKTNEVLIADENEVVVKASNEEPDKSVSILEQNISIETKNVVKKNQAKQIPVAEFVEVVDVKTADSKENDSISDVNRVVENIANQEYNNLSSANRMELPLDETSQKSQIQPVVKEAVQETTNDVKMPEMANNVLVERTEDGGVLMTESEEPFYLYNYELSQLTTWGMTIDEDVLLSFDYFATMQDIKRYDLINSMVHMESIWADQHPEFPAKSFVIENLKKFKTRRSLKSKSEGYASATMVLTRENKKFIEKQSKKCGMPMYGFLEYVITKYLGTIV